MQAFKTGFGLGLGLVFLTLIGLPSDDSAQLARLAIPVYLLLTFYLGWRTARNLPLNNFTKLCAATLFQGVVAGAVLLAFLAFINSLHAKDVNVQRQLFDKMNTYPMSVLSGVPLDELFPEPDPNPITGQYEEERRTNPMRLSFSEKYGILNIGGLHIGGLIGLGVLLVVASFAGGVINNLSRRVDWETIRQQFRNRAQQGGLAEVGHWIMLALPLILFALLWMTVSHRTETLGLEDNIYLFNINRQLNLTSGSLIDGVSIQLAIGFLIVISGIFALRRARLTPSNLSYFTRVGITVGLLAFIIFLALWRIEAQNLRFVLPGLEGISDNTFSMLIVWLLGVAGVAYAAIGNQRPERFEVVFVSLVGLAAILAMPLYMNQYQTFILGRVALAIMFGLGLNIVVGYAGLLDLGYVAFYAIGAYTFAFIALENDQTKFTRERLNNLGWALTLGLVIVPLIVLAGLQLWKSRNQANPRSTTQPPVYMSASLVLIAVIVTIGLREVLKKAGAFDGVYAFSSFLITIPVAMSVAAFTGVLLGIPVLRLRGDYLAIVTLGFGEIISLGLKNLDGTTGGPSGAIGIPKAVPSGTPTDISNLTMMYLSVVGAAIVVLISFRLRDSRLGRSWLAMRSDEDIAQAMGINLVNTKLLAFSIGASFAGLAGMLFASQQNSIFPDDFGLEVSINVLSLVIIGGMGSIPGVVVGAIALVGLPELLRPIADYRIMMFGLLLIFTMVALPNGLMPSPSPALEAEARRLAKESEKDEL